MPRFTPPDVNQQILKPDLTPTIRFKNWMDSVNGESQIIEGVANPNNVVIGSVGWTFLNRTDATVPNYFLKVIQGGDNGWIKLAFEFSYTQDEIDNIVNLYDGLEVYNTTIHRDQLYIDDGDLARWNTESLVSNNATEVFTLADFPDAVGGFIPLDPAYYEFSAQIILPSGGFILPENSQVEIASVSQANHPLVGLATGTLFATEPGKGLTTVGFNRMAIFAFAGTLFDLESIIAPVRIVATTATFFRVPSLGIITNVPSINFARSLFDRFTNGLTLDGNTTIRISESSFVSNQLTSGIALNILSNRLTNAKLDAVNFTLGGSETAIRIDPAIPDSARVEVNTSDLISGSAMFDTSGEDDTFDSIADGLFSGTTIDTVSAGTVAAGGNLAQFNYSGSTVYVGQLVTVSGYTTNTTYNTTAHVVATDAGVSFEFDGLVFTGDEATGSFASDVLTVTTSSSVPSTAGSLVLDTDLSIEYDGGNNAYNISGLTFQVNGVFGSTRAGTWSTRGLDQKDPRVIAFRNVNQADSKYIVCGFVNNNAATIVFTDTNYTDFNMAGFVASSTIERWKLLNAANSTFVYTGNEPFDGSVNFTISVKKTGAGASDYNFKWVKSTNDGGDFFNLDDNVETTIELSQTDSNATALIVPLSVSKGDQIKPQIQSVGGSSTVTILNFSCFGEG